MNVEPRAVAGVDWATGSHQVCVVDAGGKELGNRSFPHSGQGLTAMADWILELSGLQPQHVAVGIETPHGPVVETLQGRGFRVFAINPRQLDRFPRSLLSFRRQGRQPGRPRAGRCPALGPLRLP